MKLIVKLALQGRILFILLFYFFSCNSSSIRLDTGIAIDYIKISKHDGIGERYINTRDSIVLDLSFPVLIGAVPDSVKLEVPFYKLSTSNEAQEGQFYWNWSDRWFLVSSIYDKGEINDLSDQILQQYKDVYSKVDFKKSSYEEFENPNSYLIGNVADEKYSFWEFFYTLDNDKIFRISLMGLYPKITEEYVESNGKAQIKNLLNSDKQAYLFNPEMTLLDRYVASMDAVELISFYEKLNGSDVDSNPKSKVSDIVPYLYSCVNNFEIYKKQRQQFNNTDFPNFREDYINALSENKNLSFANAKEEVLKNLDGKSILFINENHYYPRCRVFLQDLLFELRKQGFTTLVAEGIANRSSGNYSQVKEVKKGLGFYTNESEFANLLREALSLEYNIFSYSPDLSRQAKIQAESDKNTHSEGVRDRLMFLNIKELYEKEVGKGEKMIIFCGHDHLVKSFDGEYKVLGMHIQDWKPRETLVVSQALIPEYFANREDSLQSLNENINPVVAKLNGENYLGGFENMLDMLVSFPRTTLKNGVPNWVIGEGDKKIHLTYKGDQDQKYFASIYIKGEFEKFGEKLTVPYKILPFESTLDFRILDKHQEYIMVIYKRTGEKVKELKL